MRKMKDSGIEWIGMIPKDWSITKIKFLLSNENDSLKVGPFGSQLSGTDFVAEGYWVYSQRVVLDKNFEHNSMLVTKEKFDAMSAFRVRENDILITTRGTIGKICRVPKKFSEGILHPCIIKFRIDEQKYCYKLLELIFNHSGILQKQLNYLSNATTIEVIYSGTLKNLQIPFPPIDEQKKIANFLDAKCADIDQIRADVEKQIDILNDYKKSVITEAVTKGLNPKAKLKDSGIEWIGKIPEGWITKKLKYLTNQPLQYGANESGCDYDDSLPRYIRITDISMDNKLKDEGKLSLEYDKAKPYLLEDYDLLFARSGASVGKTFLYKKEYGTSAFAGYLIKASLDKKKVSPKFVYYNTLSCCYESWKQQAFTQATIQNIGAEKYNTFVIPVPPLSEQKAIADYLDKKCSAIDATIADKQKQLETLEEYKKSLIFEYVTGKKEVPV